MIDKSIIKCSALSAAAFLFVLCSVTAFAAGDRKAIKYEKNKFVPAEVDIEVDEETEDNNGDGMLDWVLNEDTYTAKKEVSIVNDTNSGNNVPAYIKTAIVPHFTKVVTLDTDGDETENIKVDYNTEDMAFPLSVAGTSFTAGPLTYNLADDWQDNWIYCAKDMSFYCKKSVAPGESTPKLLMSVSASKDYIDEKSSDDVFAQIDIISEAIQIEGDAVSYRWENVTVNSTTKELELKGD